jgi:hypothetical protein
MFEISSVLLKKIGKLFMLMFEVNREFEIIKFETFKGFTAERLFSKYNPKLFEEASKTFVKRLTEEMFISEKLPP